jgi:hypothetical protein
MAAPSYVTRELKAKSRELAFEFLLAGVESWVDA